MGRESTTIEPENVRVIPYGPLAERVKFAGSRRMRFVKNWQHLAGKKRAESQLLITSVQAMDEKFREIFRQYSTRNTRLLVINDSLGTDTLFSRLLNLNIRSPERFYVAEFGKQKGDVIGGIDLLLGRMNAAVAAHESHRRILDARIERGILHVISPSFKRLEVPIASIPKLSEAGEGDLEKFEIDVDGSYLYWPDLDVHLGWEQLRQIVDPEAAQKAQRKSREFNIRYGAAIRKVREASGLSLRSIAGLSDKQVRRIERGQCRSTSRALEKLAKAHGLETNDYMQRVAEAMK